MARLGEIDLSKTKIIALSGVSDQEFREDPNAKHFDGFSKIFWQDFSFKYYPFSGKAAQSRPTISALLLNY
jgi:hypothetical protein